MDTQDIIGVIWEFDRAVLAIIDGDRHKAAFVGYSSAVFEMLAKGGVAVWHQ